MRTLPVPPSSLPNFGINIMDGQTLVDLAERKLDDLTERYDFFVSKGDERSANIIADEGLYLSEALENNHTFFCLPYLNDFDA